MYFWNEGVVLAVYSWNLFWFLQTERAGLGKVEIATKRVIEKLEERVEGVVEGKGVCHLHKPQVEVLCINTNYTANS